MNSGHQNSVGGNQVKKWRGLRFGAPGSLDLGREEAPHNLIIKVVADHPQDTEMLLVCDQLQDRPETFSRVKILRPAPLLPGVDGKQVQGIFGGQRPLLLQFASTLREGWEHQTILVRAGRRNERSKSLRGCT